MGQQFDFLISEDSLKNTNGFEYGASEVDKNYGLNGNKMIKKGFKGYVGFVKEKKGGLQPFIHCRCIAFR